MCEFPTPHVAFFYAIGAPQDQVILVRDLISFLSLCTSVATVEGGRSGASCGTAQCTLLLVKVCFNYLSPVQLFPFLHPAPSTFSKLRSVSACVCVSVYVRVWNSLMLRYKFTSFCKLRRCSAGTQPYALRDPDSDPRHFMQKISLLLPSPSILGRWKSSPAILTIHTCTYIDR